MSLRVLVTGGAGYIGSILIPKLINENFKVTVIDNFFYKQNSLNDCCFHKNFEVFNGDVRVKDDIIPLLKKADIIIPLAAYVEAPICDKDPIGASSVNKDAIFMMLENVSKDQRILMPTTNSAYGSGIGNNNYCDEESPLNPISLYAKEKVLVEKKLLQHKNSISFRLATVFGMSPRMRLDLLVNDFTYRAINDNFIVLFESWFKRNYIHVRDVSNVFLHGIENFEKMNNQIYNVGLSNANVSKRELCEIIKKYVPNFVFPEEKIANDKDKRNYMVSNEKIEKTGYIPQISLDEGILELIKGFRMLKDSKFRNF